MPHWVMTVLAVLPTNSRLDMARESAHHVDQTHFLHPSVTRQRIANVTPDTVGQTMDHVLPVPLANTHPLSRQHALPVAITKHLLSAVTTSQTVLATQDTLGLMEGRA